jgi:uncharacterized protein YnzC (UPF0291/DUF896 family)
MDKLREYTQTQLRRKYLESFDYETAADTDTILAALYYGKRAESLTQEEINSINDL